MSEQGDSPKVSKFDSLIVALKHGLKKEQKEGRTVPETPAIDEYFEGKKGEAGSPPPEERT